MLIRSKSATILRLIQSIGLDLLFATVTMAGYLGIPAEIPNSVAGDAPKRAFGPLYKAAQQASTLAYTDIFRALTTASSIMCFFSFIVRKSDPKAGGDVAMG